MKKEKEVINIVKKKRITYFRHILRTQKYDVVTLIAVGKTESRRGPGKRQTSWLQNSTQLSEMTSVNLFRTAVNKIKWAKVSPNVLEE